MHKTFAKYSLMTFSLLLCGCGQENTTPYSHNQSENHLRIAMPNDPPSLDPRVLRDLPSFTVMRMLFEGLTRMDDSGIPQPALAESMTISDDKKTYTFTLREARWSDGTPVTAADFVETWKSVLAPGFPAPNAYQLYLIKGAKEAKEGHIPLDKVGITAPTPKILIVELEKPAPYFLEIVSCPFAYPVPPAMRQQGSIASAPPTPFVSNGPFKLNHHTQRNEIAVVKNPAYWDSNAVKLDKITLQILDENTALQLFKEGSLDWAGSPLSTIPQDAVTPLKQQSLLSIAPGAGTHWFRFNTDVLPFNNEAMRRAFALALNRQAIVEHVTQGNQIPAIGIVPPALGIRNQNYYADNDLFEAKKLFQTALKEMNLTTAQLPKITLKYAANDRNHKIAQAVQQQWNKAFHLNVALESTEAHVLYERMRQGTYQISLGSWYADIQDPINFLEIFKSKDNPTNQTFWQTPQYASLIEESSLENDPSKRLLLMAEAEKILIGAMPVAPLFHSAYNYLKSPNLEGVLFSSLGYLDCKNAHFVSETSRTPPK